MAGSQESLSAIGQIDGSISAVGQLIGSVSAGGGWEVYTGDYEVTPDAHNEQVLETASKILRENITVHKVPFEQNHNPSGGMTAYIATEV